MAHSDSLDRCPRCRMTFDEHAVAIIDNSEKRYICPREQGHAASYESTMGFGPR